MNPEQAQPSASGNPPEAGFGREPFGFGAGPTRTPPALLPWAVAGVVVLLLVLGLVLTGKRKPAAPTNQRQQDDYAAKLIFSDLQMSESTSLSGGKSTFIDGQVRNTGDQTVSDASLQVAFANDEALPPQLLVVPLSLIRAREPYVDTAPLRASPLAPGSQREFRLIFEGIGTNWNQQVPQVRVTHVFTQCNPCR